MAESLSRLWTEAMQEEERYVGDLSVKKGVGKRGQGGWQGPVTSLDRHTAEAK